MQEFIKTLNIYDYASFRKACIEGCNVDRATWSNWVNEKNKPETKYRTIINKVATDLFGRVVFDD